MLAGGNAAFLEADSGSIVDAVRPEEKKGRRVHRDGVRRLAPGDYVLLRTRDGSDDLIRVLADRLLGERAKPLREQQQRWKTAVAAAVGRRGHEDVMRDLRARGLQANNLRFWLGPDSIRTARESDFRILMEFAGIGDDADRLWRLMASLERAHTIAGVRLRQALEEEVEKLDMVTLQRDGFMAVELGLSGAGALGIFRVEGFSPDASPVPRSWLRVVQKLEDDSWLA